MRSKIITQHSLPGLPGYETEKESMMMNDDATASVTDRTERYGDDTASCFLDEVQHPYASRDYKWTVCFDLKVSVQEIPSHTTFKKKVRSKCWYSREEKNQMEVSAIKSAERFNKKILRKERKRQNRLGGQNQSQQAPAEDPPAATACSEGASRDALQIHKDKKFHKLYRRYRGLENMTTKGDENIVVKVSNIVNAVMDEQEVQWKEFVTNPTYDDDEALKSISSISRQLSIESCFDARLAALEDEREAIKIYAQGSFFDDHVTKDCCPTTTPFLSVTMIGLQGQNSLYRAIARKKRSTQTSSRTTNRWASLQRRGCDDDNTKTTSKKRRSKANGSSTSSRRDLLDRLKNRSSSSRDVYASNQDNEDSIEPNLLSRRAVSTGDLFSQYT